MIAEIRNLVADAARSSELRIRIACFVLLSVFAVYFGFFAFNAKESVNFIKNTGYFFMMAACVGMGIETFLVARRYRAGIRAWVKEHYRWPFLVTLTLLTVFLWSIQDVGFKVLNDEINLLGTSMLMHLDNKALSILRGYELNGTFLALGGFIDKRPLLYPFLVSLVHDVSGYRPENAFYFNLFLVPVGLTLSYTLGAMLSGKRGGYLAMLLLACFPMFNQCAHGGGFEALNVVMMMITLLCACLYLRRPEPGRLSILCISTVLLANVRYESVLFVAPVAVIIMLGWLREQKVMLSRGLFYAPILLLPVPMLHRVFEIDPENSWQLVTKKADTVFGVEYFSRNLGQAISMFFGFDHDKPVSVILSFFGVLGCALFLVLLLREKRKPGLLRADILALAWFCVGVFGLIILLLLYFWDFDDVATRRLALPILMILIFPGVAVLGGMFQSRPVMPVIIGLFVFVLFYEVAPRSAKDIYSKEYSPANFTEWKRQFAKDNEQDYNLVIDLPGFWVTHKVPSITHARALQCKELLKFHLNNRTFDNIYLVESFTKDLENGVLRSSKDVRLDDDFVLESVVEETFNGVVYFRISRVTDIKVEVPDWIWDDFEETRDFDYSRAELLEYQRAQQRRLAFLLP